MSRALARRARAVITSVDVDELAGKIASASAIVTATIDRLDGTENDVSAELNLLRGAITILDGISLAHYRRACDDAE